MKKQALFLFLVVASCQQAACPSPAGGVCDPRSANCPHDYYCALAEVCTRTCTQTSDCWVSTNYGCRNNALPGQTLPILVPGTTIHLGVLVAVILPFVFWAVMARSVFGFQIRVVGSAPQAARHGGFDSKQTIWLAMLIGGAMAGLAGSLEFTGALKTINLGFPSGYGFTAIIVSFLGRLHPIGCLIAGIVLADTYVGGQLAKTSVHIPDSTAGIFQAMMLFFILASDIFVRYRLRIVRTQKVAPAMAAGE